MVYSTAVGLQDGPEGFEARRVKQAVDGPPGIP